MHAVIADSNGRLNWEEVSDPKIKENQVLLEIHATALNRADLLQRAGQYPPPPGWPAWFGLEAAGIIREIGAQVKTEGKWHIGDKVCALLGGGGYAEYVAVPAGMLLPIPEGLSMTEAAALPEVYGASYLFLFYEGKMKAGDTVLVQAGGSGLASVLIPMAKSFGARVITTVLSDETAAAIAPLNADLVINTSKHKLADVMKRELEDGRGVDIVIDCLGGSDVSECLPYLSRHGRWIMIATLAGDIASVNLKTMYAKGLKLIGTTLRSRSSEEKAEILEKMVSEIWPKVSTGEIRPTIFQVFSIQEAEEAQAVMAANKHVGKIVLKVR